MSKESGSSRVGEIAAGVIALAAIALAVWEGWENRTHNRLSVVPKLDAQRNFDMTIQTFELTVISSGLGPAVVRNTWLYLDGKEIYNSDMTEEFPWRPAYGIFGPDFDVYDAYFGAGHYMTPGNAYQFLQIEKRDGANRSDTFRDTANRIDVVVCYCSVYGDACRTEHVGLNAIPTPHCGTRD